MRKSLLWLVGASWLMCGAASMCLAGTPGILNYQGRVAVNGTNYQGTGQFRFALVDGGRLVQRPPSPPRWVYQTYWSHDGSSVAGSAPTSSVAVAVATGLYAVLLGDTNVPGMTQTIPPTVFTNAGVYLRVWFDDGTTGAQQVAPDQRVAAVGYALQAASVQLGGVTEAMLAEGAVTSGKIAAGAVQPHHVDTVDAVAYQGFLAAVQSVGGDGSFALADLAPVTGINGGTPSFEFVIDGAPFGTVLGFVGNEGISRPYAYVVEAVHPGPRIDPATQIGRQGRLSFKRNGRTTTFGGVIVAASVAFSGTNLLYSLRLESPLAYLALTKDYRVYQGVKAYEVATVVCDTVMTNGFDRSLTSSYSVHDFMVQYGETSLDFFHRLLEREGIFYSFDQAKDPPVLVLRDDSSDCPAAPNSPFEYYGNVITNEISECIRTFHRAIQESTLKSSIGGYDFKRPDRALLATATGTAGRGEDYHFGTDILTPEYHLQLAVARQDRQGVERNLVSGSASAPDLRAGHVFVVTDRTGAELGGSYLVTAVRHAGYCRMTSAGNTVFYGNKFEAIPAAVPFRPAVRTPKPVAQMCTAVVTGPGGQKIYADKYGRVKVQFHWDRLGGKDEKSSAWLRVASPFAGSPTNHGMFFLPRVGDEVLVSFIQGDPDQPVIVGSLYNGAAMPPYALPDSQWTSTIRSSSLSGNVNEIRFNDLADEEELLLQAGKDLQGIAANNLDLEAGQDLSLLAAGNLQLEAPQILLNGKLTINGAGYPPANPVLAWATVAANGSVTAHSGVASVANPRQGVYSVTLSRAAESTASLVPIAVAQLNAQPTTPAAMRVAAVDQVSNTSFMVYVLSGTGVATNSAFVLMVTGR